MSQDNIVKNQCASDQLGWRLNLIEASARGILSHFPLLGIEGEEAKKFRGYLDEIVKVARERFMEATGGK